ncbi:MAG: hypothetical protein E7439_03075 [Ruminococcaceae bacterium]|nr:hypothetical protein [Oscillospiraceae bacterium]
MKLRTSFCNPGVIRKNITRFAPLWGIYLVGGLLVMLTGLADSDSGAAARSLGFTIGPFSIINLAYAALCAQMLFGDLYNSRMCYALHATPLRREAWFFSHVISGLAFSIVPHLVLVFLLLPVLQGSWAVAWLWLLGMTLEFVFFFGLAVFSALCAGNRLAMAAVYGILNFGALIVYWFVFTIYEPLLYGISVDSTPFIEFCPVVSMVINEDLLIFEHVENAWPKSGYTWRYMGLGEGWGYLILCAVLGLLLLGGALLLYRRRKLEAAGSFIAIKGLEPVFAVVFALCAGGASAVFGQLFDENIYLIYLVVGLILGWFAGQMLLRRSIKVFQWKTFLKLGILGLALGGTLLLTSIDPLGITRWVPKPEKIVKAELSLGSRIVPESDNYLSSNELDVQQILDIHEMFLAQRDTKPKGMTRKVILRYRMADGREVSRTYTAYENTDAWNALQRVYNSPREILGWKEKSDFLNAVTKLTIQGYPIGDLCGTYERKYGKSLDWAAVQQELAEAIWADAEAGVVPQELTNKNYKGHIGIAYNQKALDNFDHKSLIYYTDSRNIMAWMKKYATLVALVE